MSRVMVVRGAAGRAPAGVREAVALPAGSRNSCGADSRRARLGAVDDRDWFPAVAAGAAGWIAAIARRARRPLPPTNP